jgi:hypothetical protein
MANFTSDADRIGREEDGWSVTASGHALTVVAVAIALHHRLG